MRLLVTGTDLPDLASFKRLLLIASEVGFIDAPSVKFGDWGTIGRPSGVRQWDVRNLPVTLSAHEAQTDLSGAFYVPYALADLENHHFRRAVFEALKNDRFAWSLIQKNAHHGKDNALGSELRQDLLSDESLASCDLNDQSVTPIFDGRFRTEEHRRALFKNLVLHVSINLTASMLAANRAGLSLVSDDPDACRLLNLRMSDTAYVGQGSRSAGALGMAILTALVPDEVLAQLSFDDIFDYRSRTREAYSAWSAELDQLSITMDSLDPDDIGRRLPDILRTDVGPRLRECRNEMKSARDRMWGGMIKKAVEWRMPVLTLACYSGLGLGGAISLFAGLASVVVPPLVDYKTDVRKIRRSNSAAYLIDLVADSGDSR